MSKCCGRKVEIGFDVKDMNTPVVVAQTNNPMIVIDGVARENNPERK